MTLVDQVTEQLKTIELKDEDISEYITGIIEDESMEEDEKREVIADFLAEATDKSTDALIDTLLKDWKSHQEDKLNQEKEQKQKKLEQVKAQEKMRQEKAEQEQQQLVAERNAQKEKSSEEKKERNKLLEQYSYVQDGPENNQQPEPDTKEHRRKGKAPTAGDPLLEANRNADLVKEKEKARRDQMKSVSDKEKERNKMLMDKQKKEKVQDKEKKKTQKGERRRM